LAQRYLRDSSEVIFFTSTYASLLALVLTGLSPLSSFAQAPASEVPLELWLGRMQEATRHRAYAGTFVVSSGSNMASAKIWHVCDGTRQLERIESLSGPARSTFRYNDQVVTFLRDTKIATVEKRESLGLFPNFDQFSARDIGLSYQFKVIGSERVAGYDSERVHLVPKDNLRYGYRIWSEKKTGLVLQLQTVDLDGQVLEQVAFSDLQLDVPVSVAKLSQEMVNTQGYRVEHLQPQKTTAADEGWVIGKVVPGFKTVGCYRPASTTSVKVGDPIHPKVQWVFSDGLATVSLFAETYKKGRDLRVGLTAMGGATHSVVHRLGEWWIVAVGEVPPATLNAFAQGLERRVPDAK
jgi:sigma-E factor negative regulatory protein RseB